MIRYRRALKDAEGPLAALDYVGNAEIGECDFEQITVPTLGVHAADDPLASYDDAARW